MTIRLAGIAIPSRSGNENLPLPAPVIERNPVAVAIVDGVRNVEGPLITPDATVYPDRPFRYSPMFFGDYYGRVFILPYRLFLVDPINERDNGFLAWNATFGSILVSSISVDVNVGLTIDVEVGDSLPILKLRRYAAVVSAQAPTIQTSLYDFGFSDGSTTPFTVAITRTTLISAVPERPVIQTLMWKTDIVTARDGSEQRTGSRQLPRQEIKLNFVFETEEEQYDIYRKLATQGNTDYNLPAWWASGRLLSDAAAGATQIEIDTTTFEIKAGDQLYIKQGDVALLVNVILVQGDQTTVFLASSLDSALDTTASVHQLLSVALPDKLSLKRAPVNNLTTELSVRPITERELFTGTTTFEEITLDTILGDRVIDDVVYTLAGVPILHARPLVDDSIEESFDWNFEVIDNNTGPITRFATRIMAAVNYPRKFFVKNRTQEFYWNAVLKYCHGRRLPVWLPTWVNDLGETDIALLARTQATIPNEQYLARFPNDDSHRGLWIRYGQGYLARRILTAEPDGNGNTVLTLDREIPSEYVSSGPHDIGFLVLARQGTDDVQIERWPFYSFLTTSFTSTRSTSGAA